MPKFSFSAKYGGSGGNQFEDPQIPDVNKYIAGWKIRSGEYIDSVQLIYSDAKTTEQHGGGGGDPSLVMLNAGERITSISGKSGRYVDHLTIVTSNNFTYDYGGQGGGGGSFSIPIPANKELIGFFGSSGDVLDNIGVIFREP